MLRSEWTCWEDALETLQEMERMWGPNPQRETLHTLEGEDFLEVMSKCHYGMELSRREALIEKDTQAELDQRRQ